MATKPDTHSDFRESAADLCGRDIGKFIRWTQENAANVTVGEICQVYAIGGQVTISYHALFGSGELLEMTLADNDRPWIYEWDQLKEIPIKELEA